LHFYSTDRHATESYTLSLHDALPICEALRCHLQRERSVATECFTVPDKNSNENWTISLFRVRYLLCVLVSSTSSLSSCEQVFYVFITPSTGDGKSAAFDSPSSRRLRLLRLVRVSAFDLGQQPRCFCASKSQTSQVRMFGARRKTAAAI